MGKTYSTGHLGRDSNPGQLHLGQNPIYMGRMLYCFTTPPSVSTSCHENTLYILSSVPWPGLAVLWPPESSCALSCLTALSSSLFVRGPVFQWTWIGMKVFSFLVPF
ncbi:hypothetical protein ATANTOWER_009446 [Ataeniobius toweri]|uniref:Uncharacterized protein n=1 Tax=Ataeniobius toweri TaxID=208326 RepID=A0ABU7B8J3_9TELE|nr:hypothetical protein [Ataeniobius toweri]